MMVIHMKWVEERDWNGNKLVMYQNEWTVDGHVKC